MARGNGTATTTTPIPARKPAAAPATATKPRPVPAKALRNFVALMESHRLEALAFLARETGAVSLNAIAHHLGVSAEEATLVVGFLKQRGWLAGERTPKGSGGGWRYKLSDAGRERLMVLGG